MTTQSTATTTTLATLLQEMAPSREWSFFDHASLSPLPARTAERMHHFVDEAARVGNTNWMNWVEELEQVRTTSAHLLGASRDEIAIGTNTTAGINFVAEGLDWQAGDNVVTLADEFPTNLYPWLHLESKGVEIRQLKTEQGRLDHDQLAAACDSRTRIVSVSWVGFQTGYRLDLDKIAQITHNAGGLLFVDAIQGLGVFPLDVSQTPIDFLSSGGHKWLLGPEGAGIVYIRQEHLERLRPVGVGWNSVAKPFDYSHVELKFKPTAGRFEGGTWNMVGILAMGQSLELLHSIGTQTLSRQVLEYTDLACEQLQSAGATIVTDRDLQHRSGEQRSGIVFFEMPGHEPNQMKQHCKDQGVAISCRAGKLRISPHAYNTQDDLDRLISALTSA